MRLLGDVLVGPTAIGKTEVAQHAAERASLPILSADSMLVYRGLDIGTAKPSAGYRARVPYWGLDVASPTESFSVVAYLDRVREGLRGAGVARILVVGGTGLYVRALLAGLRAGSGADDGLRRAWEARVVAEGLASLQGEVASRHPAAFAALSASDRANPRRLLRLLERGDEGADRDTFPTPPPIVALRMEAPALRERIQRRAAAMFQGGLLDEVRDLRAAGFAPGVPAAEAIGYREAIGVLDGALSAAQAIEGTARRTWQLARKQMTWFRHQATVRWVDVGPHEDPAHTAERVERCWQEIGPCPLHGLDDR